MPDRKPVTFTQRQWDQYLMRQYRSHMAELAQVRQEAFALGCEAGRKEVREEIWNVLGISPEGRNDA